MMNVYESCPVLQTVHYTLRLVEPADAPALLSVYSDERAVPFFNGDNCHGDDFHYTTMERMDQAINFWLQSYRCGSFVRWAILDRANVPIGTAECFRRGTDGSLPECALLRLDLRSDLEVPAVLHELLAELTAHLCKFFGCAAIATKARSMAAARCEVLQALGYKLSAAPLIGEGGVQYRDYWVKQ